MPASFTFTLLFMASRKGGYGVDSLDPIRTSLSFQILCLGWQTCPPSAIWFNVD